MGSLQIGFPVKEDYRLYLGQRLSLFRLFSALEPLSLLAPGLFYALCFLEKLHFFLDRSVRGVLASSDLASLLNFLFLPLVEDD